MNSLHVTGNDGERVVLDTGLTSQQRAFLSVGARVVTVDETFHHPVMAKTFATRLEPPGVVVIIDSDMIVTGSLHKVLALARGGSICAYPDMPAVRSRWFPEWETALRLRSPLRRETYVNSGFVVVDTRRWPRFLRRWEEVCRLVPVEAMFGAQSPLNAPDQDALNALLMSELPTTAVARLPAEDWAFGGDARIEDIQTIRCRAHGRAKVLLHFLDRPKPWERNGWLRLGGRDYVSLMRRLLFADDIPLRVAHDDVPLWLRPTPSGKAALRVLGAANAFSVGTAHRLPEPFREPLRHVRKAVSRRFTAVP